MPQIVPDASTGKKISEDRVNRLRYDSICFAMPEGTSSHKVQTIPHGLRIMSNRLPNPSARGSGYFSRREMLATAGAGFGAVALQAMLADVAGASDQVNQQPHHVARAKSVIFVFLEGGPSHLDLLDPKPELT